MSYILFVVWLLFVRCSYLIAREHLFENWYDSSSWYLWSKMGWYLSLIIILGLLIPKIISIGRKDLLCVLWGVFLFASLASYQIGVLIVYILIILGILILDKPTK